MDALTAWFEAIDKASLDGVGHAGKIAITKHEEKGNEIRLVGFAGTADLDRHDDVVAHGAYSKHLRAYLEVNPQVLWQHDHDEPIGRAVEARETEQGLHVVDVIPASGDLTPTQQKAVTLIRQGLIRTLSIGAIVHGREWVEGTDAKARGVESYRKLTDLELVEHSLVTIPANRGATFQVVASLGRDVERRRVFSVPVKIKASMDEETANGLRTLAQQLRAAADTAEGLAGAGGEEESPAEEPEDEKAAAVARALGLTG